MFPEDARFELLFFFSLLLFNLLQELPDLGVISHHSCHLDYLSFLCDEEFLGISDLLEVHKALCVLGKELTIAWKVCGYLVIKPAVRSVVVEFNYLALLSVFVVLQQ